MKKSSSIWLIIAAVLVAAGLLVFLGAMAVSHWDLGIFDKSEYVTDTVDVNEAFQSIMIRSHTEDIVFKPSEDGKCRVVFYVPEDHEHKVSVQDNTLTVKTEEPRSWTRHISFFSAADSEITVYLPETEYAKLSIEENTGDIALPKDLSFEQISISAATGDVNCAASVSGEMRISAGTGDIRLQDLTAGTLDLSVSTGKITLDHVSSKGRIGISVSTGKTSLSDISCLSFSSEGSTGDVYLTNVIADGMISVTRSTGDIRLYGCDAASLDLHTTTGSIQGTLLTPKFFEAHTTTGHIDVPGNGSADAKCTVSTTTGDIIIEIGK